MTSLFNVTVDFRHMYIGKNDQQKNHHQNQQQDNDKKAVFFYNGHADLKYNHVNMISNF